MDHHTGPRCTLLEYTASYYAPLIISLYALSTPSPSSSRPVDHSALAARTCGMHTPAAAQCARLSRLRLWPTQTYGHKPERHDAAEAARESTVITRGAHAQGEKARTEIDGAQRGENTVITQQLRENEAISARAEVNGARIFMPSDVFGQHTLGSLN
ncbi:hypothetical protein C8J57DRAFT_1250557 [Mycena rebaudengoi]|nr:hypothetical protein C8J57DRAFT_1250557 [Mycena rebaudengoi]